MKSSAIRVLVIDQDEGVLRQLQAALTASPGLPPAFIVTGTERPVTALAATALASGAAWEQSACDVLLVCFNAQAEALLPSLIDPATERLPILAVVDSEADGRRALAYGVTGYFLRDQLAERGVAQVLTLSVEHAQLQRQVLYLERELTASEDRFRHLVLNGADGLLIVRRDGVICFANAAAERLLGHDLDALIGSANDLPLVLGHVTTITLPGATEAGLSHHEPLAPRALEVRTLETHWEDEPAFLVTLREVSDQRHYDHALRSVVSANKRLHTAISTFTSGVFMTDPNLPGNPITFANPACLSITGYTHHDELLGQTLSVFFGPQTDITTIERIHTAINQRQSYHGIVLNYRKDGQAFWNELTLNPIFDEQHRLTNFIGVQTDVTDRVERMDLLQHRRRIEKLVTDISSEFVNLPLELMDASIRYTLQRMGRFVGADRCTVAQVSEDGESFIITHEWHADGIPSLIGLGNVLDSRSAPWFYAHLSRFELVIAASLDSLPAGAAAERDLLQSAGVKSILTVPMSRDNRLVGYLGFATLRHEKPWSEADVGLLKLVGEILFGALDRKHTMLALRQSEERFRVVVSNTPMLMVTFDQAGIITFVEGQALNTLGLAKYIRVGRTISEQFSGVPEVIHYSERALAGESLLATIQTEIVPNLVMETWFTPTHAPDGSIMGGNAVAWDISERYRAQLAEREQRVLAEALRDTAGALTRSLDPEEVMNEILDNASRVVPHVSSSIVLIQSEVGAVMYARGLSREFLGSKTHLRVPLELSTFRYMKETGHPCLIPDVTQFAGWRRFAGMDYIKSYLGVPIMAFGEVVGFLNLDSDIVDFFTPVHAERLKAFADQAAIAIQNAQLYDQVRNDAQQLVVLNKATNFLHTSLLNSGNLLDLSNRVADVVSREFGKLDCGVVLADEHGLLHRVTRAGQYQAVIESTPAESALLGMVITTGEAIYIPNTETHPTYVEGDARTRSRFIVPLRTSNEVIGALDLHSMQPEAFAEPDRDTLVAFAERVATIIDNARLYQQMISHNERLDQAVRERTRDLADERARLGTILNSMHEAVLAWEASQTTVTIQYTNNAFCQMFRYDTTSAVGVPDFYLKLLSTREDRDRVRAVLTEGLKKVSFSRLDTKAIRADGSTFDAQITFTRLNDSGAQSLGGVLLIRDISQDKALQSQRDRFIANASHELRTPLANLKLRSYLLEKQPEKRDDHLKVMRHVVERMQYLMEDLLDITRFEQGRITLKRQATTLQTVIHDVVEMEAAQASEKRLVLHTAMPTDPVRVSIDESRFRQVMTNLLVNAINYTPAGGEITVSLEIEAEAGAADPFQVIIRVQDTGIGIAPDLLERIFLPFVRANDGTTRGTGLGLTIAKEIVTLHGGTISVQSEERVGTTFTIALPSHA